MLQHRQGLRNFSVNRGISRQVVTGMLMVALAVLLSGCVQSAADAAEGQPTATAVFSASEALALTQTAAPTEVVLTPTATKPANDQTTGPQAPGEDTALPTHTPVPTATPEVPATRIVIPKLDIDEELIESPIVDGQWDVSFFRNEIAHLEGTSYPGTEGNAVIAGHVQHRYGNGPFLDLDTLEPGDLIYALGPGVTYTYEVQWIDEVEPTNVQVTFPTEDPSLTLITCDTWDWINRVFVNRLIVRAVMVESEFD